MDEFVFIFRTHVRTSRILFKNCPQKRDFLFCSFLLFNSITTILFLFFSLYNFIFRLTFFHSLFTMKLLIIYFRRNIT